MKPEKLEMWRSRIEDANPKLFSLLELSRDKRHLKRLVFEYLAESEHSLADPANPLHPLEVILMREAIEVMRSIAFKRNEARVGISALDTLRRLAHRRTRLPRGLRSGFFMEMEHLFLVLAARARVYQDKRSPLFLMLRGRRAAKARTEDLDAMQARAQQYMDRYPDGLRPEVVARRQENRARILDALGGTEEDWADWRWHISHYVRDLGVLERVLELSDAERRGVALALETKVPFGITPYYLSLMDRTSGPGAADHAVRAQVLPPEPYVRALARGRRERSSALDFMGERDTTPVPLVVRRYPMIVILKAANTCPQICVYCQRNWEIEGPEEERAIPDTRTLKRAIDWIADHGSIFEVLVTGGDPFIVPDDRIYWVLDQLSAIGHVERVRIGTRTPVTLPQRLTPQLVDLIGAYHEPGRREMVLVTHVEHLYEATPEMVAAVQRVRRLGISVYNQMVYTVENSRRFEAAATRRMLRLVGIEPYYTFNMKGKEEMRGYRVPIARILQEQKEEARLMPGLVRTDNVVYNVPRLGKNPITRGQHHQLIGVLPNGRRVYEFHPWEKKLSLVDTYVGTDVPIKGYLEELERRGEDPEDYESIWYYY